MIWSGLLLLAVLLIPGYLLARLINVSRYLLPVSVSFSYLLFLGMLHVASQFAMPMWGMNLTYGALVLLLACLSLGVRGSKDIFGLFQVDTMFSATVSTALVAGIVAFLSVYFLIFGVYDELPSDFYRHMQYAFNADNSLANEGFGVRIAQRNREFYLLVAWIMQNTGNTVIGVYPAVIIVSGFLFLFSFAACADRLYRAFDFSRNVHQFAVAAAVFFVFSQMGLTALSYFRYYGFAPTMLNMAVYFTGLIFIVGLFEKDKQYIRHSAVLLATFVVAANVHFQEGLFIMLAAVLMLAWHILWELRPSADNARTKRIVYLILAGILISLLLFAFLWIRFNYRYRGINQDQIFELSVTYLGRLFVINPSSRFFSVITVWGGFVFVLFVAYFREMVKQPFLVLGMLSPLLTMFNPVFTDMFLRVGHSTTLWRMSYFVPIHYAGGVLVVLLFLSAVRAGVLKKMLYYSSIAGLILLLLPSIFGFPINKSAKITLGKVGEENSWHHWQDLVEFAAEDNGSNLNTREPVLTDPVTGYLLRSLTGHRSYNYKFIPSRSYYQHPFSFESYDDFPLSRYSGQVIVVNLRNGGESVAGEKSGHWNRHVLRVSDYYSDKLLPHLQKHPDRFEKIWSSSEIFIYRIL